MKVRCVHGDIHEYPVVPVEIKFQGEKYSLKGDIFLKTHFFIALVCIFAFLESLPTLKRMF